MKFMHCLAAAGLVMTALASVVRAQEEIPSRVTATSSPDRQRRPRARERANVNDVIF